MQKCLPAVVVLAVILVVVGTVVLEVTVVAVVAGKSKIEQTQLKAVSQYHIFTYLNITTTRESKHGVQYKHSLSLMTNIV